MKKILIIKLGAIGDVVSTTPLLRVIKGNITWVTLEESVPILKGLAQIKSVLPFYEFRKVLKNKFDWAINLEEDWKARALFNLVDAKKKTEWCRDWCLLSIDDDKKKANKKTYQYFMFKTIGRIFKGEEYLLRIKPKDIQKCIVGIELRSGDCWKMKRWNKYTELIEALKKKEIAYRIFEYHRNIIDFVRDINKCKVVITGDTLTMHLALGLRKKVIALFGPTSSAEIYDYGRLTKIVAPIKCQCCYKRECDKKPNCMDLIIVDTVVKALSSIIKE